MCGLPLSPAPGSGDRPSLRDRQVSLPAHTEGARLVPGPGLLCRRRVHYSPPHRGGSRASSRLSDSVAVSESSSGRGLPAETAAAPQGQADPAPGSWPRPHPALLSEGFVLLGPGVQVSPGDLAQGWRRPPGGEMMSTGREGPVPGKPVAFEALAEERRGEGASPAGPTALSPQN